MKKILPYFLIFIITFALFLWLQDANTIGDPDTFYHAKITDLIIQNKNIVKNFPWLPFTILEKNYTDHHLLFHILLVPFILLLKHPLIATKLAASLFAAAFFVIFYILLKKWQIKYALLYAILPLTSFIIPLRFSLGKAPAASLLVFILGIYFIFKRKTIALFIISFIFVWLHGAWPILFIVAAAYCFAGALLKTPAESQKENLKILLSCFLGLTAGLVLNPYFPQNLYFYWVQIFKVAAVNYHQKISVGAEWYPSNPLNFIQKNLLVNVLWLFAVGWFLANYQTFKKTFLKNDILALFILSAGFFIYTVKSARMGEYFTPLAIFFIALFFNPQIQQTDWRDFWRHLKNFILHPRFLFANALIIFLIIGGLISLAILNLEHYKEIRSYLKNYGAPFDNFKKACEFLKNNTPPQSMIFHNNWDFFPQLFYYNEQNRYITGLDSTFLYEKNPNLYALWERIVNGKETENLAEKIKNSFQSSYILAAKNTKRAPYYNENFIKNLEGNSEFQKIYEDEEARIFKIAK